MTDSRVAFITGAAGVAAKALGIIDGVNLTISPIANLNWQNLLSMLLTGAVTAIGGIIVNEGWKAFKNRKSKTKTKQNNP